MHFLIYNIKNLSYVFFKYSTIFLKDICLSLTQFMKFKNSIRNNKGQKI